MTEWHLIDGDNPAPRDGRPLLLYGEQQHHPDLNTPGKRVFSGYWDELDGAWCAHGSTWRGPFYNVTKWADLPTPPESE